LKSDSLSSVREAHRGAAPLDRPPTARCLASCPAPGDRDAAPLRDLPALHARAGHCTRCFSAQVASRFVSLPLDPLEFSQLNSSKMLQRFLTSAEVELGHWGACLRIHAGASLSLSLSLSLLSLSSLSPLSLLLSLLSRSSLSPLSSLFSLSPLSLLSLSSLSSLSPLSRLYSISPLAPLALFSISSLSKKLSVYLSHHVTSCSALRAATISRRGRARTTYT